MSPIKQSEHRLTEMPMMEVTNCLLCGSAKWKVRFSLEDYHLKQPGQFTLVQCLECDLIYLNPRPTSNTMNRYYPATYPAYEPINLERLPWPQRRLIEYGLWKRCRPLLKSQSRGKVLDIGCGSGQFLAAMQKYGQWQVTGVDFSAEAISFVRNNLRLEAYEGRVEEMNFPDHAFDAVTTWDTLEHLYEPRYVLTEIQRILKPEGLLLLRVPWLNSLDARLFGPYWAGLDAPRHLTVFSQATLTRLLRETGFTLKRLWCMSGSHASFVISLSFWLSQRKQSQWLKFWQHALASPIGSILSAPYFSVIDKLRLGSEITVLAKKRAEQ